MDNKELIRAAFVARSRAYAPYSHYLVGAALMDGDGNIISGCNVENASYGLCNCAERTAVFKAVSEGKHDFAAIAITGGPDTPDREGRVSYSTSDNAYPCGACRQVLREFCDPESFKVIVARSLDDHKEYTLNELLPESFGPDNLGSKP